MINILSYHLEDGDPNSYIVNVIDSNNKKCSVNVWFYEEYEIGENIGDVTDLGPTWSVNLNCDPVDDSYYFNDTNYNEEVEQTALDYLVSIGEVYEDQDGDYYKVEKNFTSSTFDLLQDIEHLMDIIERYTLTTSDAQEVHDLYESIKQKIGDAY